MFVELQDPAARDATYKTHQRMTVRALQIIFEQSAEEAQTAVGGSGNGMPKLRWQRATA